MSKKIALQEKLNTLAASDLLANLASTSPMYRVVSVFCSQVEKRNFSDAHKALIAVVEYDDCFYVASDQTKHTVRIRQRARKVLSEINALSSYDDDVRRELGALRSARKIAVKN